MNNCRGACKIPSSIFRSVCLAQSQAEWNFQPLSPLPNKSQANSIWKRDFCRLSPRLGKSETQNVLQQKLWWWKLLESRHHMLPCLGKSAWGRFDNVKGPALKESKRHWGFSRSSTRKRQNSVVVMSPLITCNLVSSLSSWQRLWLD